MALDRTSAAGDEVAALIERLRAEARASGVPEPELQSGSAFEPLTSRKEAEELWAVTSDRAFLSKPGSWGRLRGALLMPVKLLLKRLMRWYVEPAFRDQRTFNAAVLRILDDMHKQTNAAIEELQERLARLEQQEARDSRQR